MSPYTKRRRKALMSYFCVIMTVSLVSAQQPDPRWGQAWTILGSKLYVHGGKKDPTSSYSYSAAPNTAEMLSLDLSSSFQTTAAPWTTLNSPSSPAVAFHSLAPFSSSQLLVFGGDGGPQLPIATRADSAFTLDTVSDAWSALGDASAQPVRRLYSQAVYSSGKVWLTGGEKGDASGIGYQEAFTFDSKTFSALPTTDGPPDVVGHASLVSSSGQLVLLGGFSPSLAGLLVFNSSYVLDTTTTSSPKWSKIPLNGDVPAPRRDFAAAILDGDQILIHGGSDASHQTVLSDGAVLDLKTGTWKSAPQLTEGLGARFGHTAAGVGSQALFSFGYSSSGPASSSLLVYDAALSQFVTSYKPPTPPQTSAPPAGTPSGSPTGLPNAPPSTPDIPNSTPTTSNSQSITTIALGTVFGALALVALGSVVVVYYVRRRRRGREWSEIEGEKVNMIGVSSGWRQQGPRALGLFSLGGKTEDRRRIDMLADEDERHFDVDPMRGWTRREMSQTSTNTQLGIGRAMYNVSGAVYAASVSSLRSVGAAFGGSTSRRGGSAHSRNDLSSSSGPMIPGWWEKEQVQMDPFDDIHGARQTEATDTPGASLLPSGATVTHFDPTGTTVGMDPVALAAAAAGTSVLGTRRNGDRPLPRREHSNTSSLHSQGSSAGYNPFSDEYARRDFGDIEEESERGHLGESSELDQLTTPGEGMWQSPFAGALPPSSNPLSDPPPASNLPQRRNPSTMAGKPQLIPLTPITSKDSSTVRTVYSHHTHEDEVFSPIENATPGTSADHHHSAFKQPQSPTHSQSYISPPSLSPTRPLSPVRPISPTRPLSQQPPPQPLISLHGSYVDDDEALPVKRSDSFWSRFSRDAFRHRTNSQSSRRGEEHHPLDFRDPNPPPARLGAIEETSASSTSPESSHIRHVSSKAELGNTARDGPLVHKKSVSSAMTADSEMLERMVTGGDMQVVQRVRTASSHHHGSATGPSTPLSAPSTLQGGFREEIVASPIDASTAGLRVTSKAPFDHRPMTEPKPGAVAQRVQAYERRTSIDTPASPPPPTTLPKRPSTTYGLVPKPKLFVANTLRGGSDDSYP